MEINLKIILGKLRMPRPRKREPLDICKEIDKLITDMENTETSEASWKKLKAIHKKISEDKNFPNRDKLLDKIVPVLSRFAQYDNNYTDLKAEELA